MGWRYFLYTTGAVSLVVFFLRFFVFTFRETPKFLLAKGRDDDAIATMQHIAKFNKNESGITKDLFEALEREHETELGNTSSQPMLRPKTDKTANLTTKTRAEFQRYKLLFSSLGMARLTILVWLTYAMDFSGFTISGTPTIHQLLLMAVTNTL